MGSVGWGQWGGVRDGVSGMGSVQGQGWGQWAGSGTGSAGRGQRRTGRGQARRWGRQWGEGTAGWTPHPQGSRVRARVPHTAPPRTQQTPRVQRAGSPRPAVRWVQGEEGRPPGMLGNRMQSSGCHTTPPLHVAHLSSLRPRPPTSCPPGSPSPEILLLAPTPPPPGSPHAAPRGAATELCSCRSACPEGPGPSRRHRPLWGELCPHP